jgi:FixJ family two-component response regulator
MSKNRVIVIDDEADVREGLHVWLAPNYEVLSFACAQSFLASITDACGDDAPPTCLLLDFQMPGMNGVELQTQIKRLNMAYPIIFMSGAANQSDIIDAWRGGANDFILKPFTTQDIDSVLAEAFSLANPIWSRRTSVQSIQQDQPKKALTITRREAQVLHCFGKGMQQSEIAEMLGVSIRTVKMYRASLKEKHGLTTLVDIGAYCEINRKAIDRIAMIEDEGK